MGLLDDIGSVAVDFIESQTAVTERNIEIGIAALQESDADVETFYKAIVEGQERDQQAAEDIAQVIEKYNPGDEAMGFLLDSFEESLLSSIKNEGELTPENVEGPLDDMEGTATALAVSWNTLVSIVEAIPLEDIDLGPREIAQVLSFAGIDGLVGREIDATLQEGVDPALKQLVHREHRSKQADFQDFVDANIRQKNTDPDIDPRDEPVGSGIEDLLHPDDLGWLSEPAEYGTRPGQEALYELVGLGVSEPEEIIEEPIQYGIPVPKRPVETLGELQGFPEDVKQIYLEVIEQLPKTENLLQDYVRLTEFNFRLREAVEEGRTTPERARKLIEPELEDIIENALPEDRYRDEDRTSDEVVDILADELERNFNLLDSIPGGVPTQGDIEAWLQKGVVSLQEFETLYEQFGPQTAYFDQYAQEAAIDAGWEAIQRQHALGRIGRSDAASRLSLIGFTDEQAQEILDGADGDSLVSAEVSEDAEPSARPPSALVNIGEAREAALDISGASTARQVAALSVQQLVDVTGMTDTEATQTLAQAQQLVSDDRNQS